MAVSIFGFPTPTPIPQTILNTRAAMGKIREQNIANRYAPLLDQAKLTGMNQSNQYYPQISNAKLALLNSQSKAQEMENQNYPAMTRAKLALISAQAERAKAPEQAAVKIINTPKGVFSYNPATGQTTPLNDAQGKQLMPLVRGGLSISQTPAGGWTITEGGTNPVNGPQTPGAPGNMQDNGLVQTPASPHSKFSNAGSTLYDPKTGQYVSTPTNATVGRLQRSMVGEYGALPALYEILRDIAPEQGLTNLPKRGVESILSAFGAKEPQYTAYKGAIKTLIPQTAEAMVNAYGLNATNENVNKIIDSIHPDTNESKYSYAYQIAQTLGNLVIKEKAYQNFLKHGIDLEKLPPKDRLHTAIENIYQDLMTFPGMSDEKASPQVPRRTLEIPKFKSQSELRSWYKNLPPDQQEIAYQKIKANEGKK